MAVALNAAASGTATVTESLDVKVSVRIATTANITLSGEQTIDGVAVVADDRVLVKDQSTGSENGIYAAATGAWTRALDADTDDEVNAGMNVFVEEGTANADTQWLLTTNAPITLGTTALTFADVTGGAAGVTVFTGLTDTPADYSGAGLDILRVNSSATAVEFVDETSDFLTQYVLEAGRAGNRTWVGSTDAGGSLTIRATSGTAGPIIFERTSAAENGRFSSAGNLFLNVTEAAVVGTARVVNLNGDIRFNADGNGLRFNVGANTRELRFLAPGTSDTQVDRVLEITEAISGQRGAGLLLTGAGTQGAGFAERGVGVRMTNGATHNGVMRILGDNSRMELRTNSALPLELWTNGAQRVVIASDGLSFDVVTGVLRMGGTDVINASRRFALDWEPDTDNVRDVGHASRRVGQFIGRTFRVINSLGDLQPTAVMTGSTIRFGAGGASVTDITISRGAANRLDLAAGDTFRTDDLDINSDNGIDFLNQTDGAGAGAGTLSNAPSAGDPAFWIRVKIAGANRFIPAWS